jgi:branched-subunit amino acid aminotransferase/4-amino-4-deoxychorismate lyase
MATTTQPCLLFSATPAGAQPLPTPSNARDANEAFDDLPLGIYEGLRTFEHVRLYALDAHLDRAQRSMDLLGWGETLDRRTLCRALHEALVAAPWPDARVRFDVLAEPAASLGTESRMLVALSPFVPVPDELMRLGTWSRLVTDLARAHPRIKEARFVVDRRIHPGGTREDYEPIMVDARGRLLEGTSSNVFAVRDGVLRTAGEGVLEGVTRAAFLELARGAGIPVRTDAIELDELPALSEAFLTSSVRSLVPIVRMGDTTIGDGRPGPVGKELARRYAELVAREARPAWPMRGEGR